jgi:hypothetical protein
MDVLFKAVTAPIWNYPAVLDVDFTDGPGAETWLRKYILQERRGSNLNISGAHPQSF